jgi:hypothetical protein
MTEREDWVLDPEKLGDSCTHDQPICSLDADGELLLRHLRRGHIPVPKIQAGAMSSWAVVVGTLRASRSSGAMSSRLTTIAFAQFELIA